MNRRFENKTVLITGAARGQGRSHAVQLAQEGANVIAMDMGSPPTSTTYAPASPADLAETVRLVEAAGGHVEAVTGDVRSWEDVRGAVEQGLQRFGTLDGAVANAGVVSYGRLWELTDDQWHEMVSVNLTGVWHTLRAAIPPMIEGGGGSIVVIGSGGGLKGLPYLSHYCATKHGLVGMVKAVAHEVGEYGIRVNSVHPTGVRTPMSEDPTLGEMIGGQSHLVRAFDHILPMRPGLDWMEPEDISHAVLFLLSSQARWVTATALPVDAGQSQF